MYTDGYTCRVLFCRRSQPHSLVKNITLELEDFNADEVNRHFKPCGVDPGRKDLFVSYHGSNELKRLSTKDYYSKGGITRSKRKELELKKKVRVYKILMYIFHLPKVHYVKATFLIFTLWQICSRNN